MSEHPVDLPEAPEAAPETTVEAAIISPDAQVVEANLANAQPVVAGTIEPVATEAVPGATTEEAPATEETPAEPAAPAAEKKEGSGLVAFIKKAIPNPKTVEKKAPKPEAEATSAPEIVEPAVEEGPFEGDAVTFKSHGGIFGTSWKSRRLEFGKEDGLSNTAVLPYLAVHKISALVTATDKANAAWDSAAHATVTGVGLLYVVKFKNVDVPINIINLAHVTDVTVSGNHFTIKTEHSGDYEFGTSSPEKAQKWKTEIDTRTEQSKLARPAVVESEKYKENLASIKDLRGSKGQETAVTSDEEAAVSGDESRRKGWGRRISGSFGKLTGTSKETKEPAAEAPKDVAVVEPTESTADAAAETPAVEAAAEAGETAAPETPAEASADEPETAKKEKRKSFTGFAGLFKSKAKESSTEEPAKETATEETPAAEPTSTETPAVTETPAGTEEPATTPAPEVKEKSKRSSIFNILPKKDKAIPTPVTNGETTVPETSDDATPAEEVPAAETEDAEFKPPATHGQESLVRRLTSQFKSFGRSKSPEKSGKATKVSDEAPKIDTPIESTPAATSEPATEATPAVVEPLSTTEAPAVDLPTTTTTEQTPAVVTTQA